MVNLGNGLENAEGTAAQVAQPTSLPVPIIGAEPRRPGVLASKIALTPEFFDPLPADELEPWGEG